MRKDKCFLPSSSCPNSRWLSLICSEHVTAARSALILVIPPQLSTACSHRSNLRHISEHAGCHELTLEQTRMQCPTCRFNIDATAVSSDTLTRVVLPFVCFISRCASMALSPASHVLFVLRILMPDIRYSYAALQTRANT